MKETAGLLLKCILGVLLPPALVFIEKGLSFHFWIDLVVTLLLFWIGGAIYGFIVVFDLIICEGIAAGLLPPLAIYLQKGVCAQFWVCLLLTLFFWFPGMAFAYFILVRTREQKAEINK